MEWDAQTSGEDDGALHTASCPYCDDLACSCHTDVDYHDLVQHPTYSEDDVAQAYSFYGIGC